MAYPSSIVAFTDKVDNVDYPQAADINDAYTEIEAIETELGTNPHTPDDTVTASSTSVDVANTLDMIANMVKRITGQANWYTMASNAIPPLAASSDVNAGTSTDSYISPEALEGSQFGAAQFGIADAQQTTTDVSTDFTLDLSLYQAFDYTLAGDGTATFANPSTSGLTGFTFIVRQDGTGGRTITWPSVAWAGGNAPSQTTDANAVDIYVFITPDATNWFGFQSGKGMATS